jgi:hypothetical protein
MEVAGQKGKGLTAFRQRDVENSQGAMRAWHWQGPPAGRPWTLARRGWHAEMRARRHLAAATTQTQGRLPAAQCPQPQAAAREPRNERGK